MTFPFVLPKIWLSLQIISHGNLDISGTCSQSSQHPLKQAGLKMLLLLYSSHVIAPRLLSSIVQCPLGWDRKKIKSVRHSSLPCHILSFFFFFFQNCHRRCLGRVRRTQLYTSDTSFLLQILDIVLEFSLLMASKQLIFYASLEFIHQIVIPKNCFLPACVGCSYTDTERLRKAQKTSQGPKLRKFLKKSLRFYL